MVPRQSGATRSPLRPKFTYFMWVARQSLNGSAPRPDGFVLWTRLAPDPLSANPATPGGMTGGDVPVAYEIAGDEAMREIVRRGVADAEAAFAWSVHVDVSGLQPGRPYWYRFLCGDAASPVGRARTAIAAGAPVERMRFGFVSCANYENGYFAAYRHLADEDPDVVLFLGDYIYEGTQPGGVRTQRFAVTVTSGAPPAGLVDAVADRIRAREAAFEWKRIEAGGAHTVPEGHPMRWAVLIAVAAAVAIVSWALRRRAARSRRPA